MKITFPEFIPYPGNEGHLTEDELIALNTALTAAWMSHTDAIGETPFGPVKHAHDRARLDLWDTHRQMPADHDIVHEILPGITYDDKFKLIKANLDILSELYALTSRDGHKCNCCLIWGLSHEMTLLMGDWYCKDVNRCIIRLS